MERRLVVPHFFTPAAEVEIMAPLPSQPPLPYRQ